MNSVVDAMFLHNQLLADPPAIEGKIVEVHLHVGISVKSFAWKAMEF